MPLPSGLQRAKNQIYRYLKYHLVRPRAPELRRQLQGQTVVVVGSAPFSTRPAGWDASFRVMTINASQAAASAWLTQTPDVTLMQYNQIEGQSPTALEVRRVLRGKRTGTLFVLHWQHGVARLEQGLARFEYGFEQLRLMSRYERIALTHKCIGKLNLELEAASKWSNGIVGTALALHSGARRVILTGINPMSSGHAYNDMALPRLHASTDLQALHALQALGYPIFTADPDVAKATGIKLWEGQAVR